MTISTRLYSYLTTNAIPYQMIEHSHINSSVGSAISAPIPLEKIAKAVILEDHQDRNIMAIFPAKNKNHLSALNDELMGSFQLLKEREVYAMFNNCEHGAIPLLSDAYNMPAVCDELLDKLEHVYIEAGEHKNLLRVEHYNFEKIVANSKHLRFSREVYH